MGVPDRVEAEPTARDPLARWTAVARDRLAWTAAAVAALAVHALTTCRTVYVGDSGELSAVCATFGIAHPSGYPLYTLLGGAFVHLWPAPAMAFASNLFSALAASVAVWLCAALVGDWAADRPGRRAAAVGAALTLAFATAFWQEATVARVYTLNAAGWLAVLWCAGRWAVRGTTGWALATGATAGLALAHHPAAVGAVAGAAVLVVGGRWDGALGATWRRERRRLGAATAALLPGLLLYVWLPWRFAARPVVRWADIDSLGAWVGYVLRTGYTDRSWSAGDPVRIAQALGHGLWVVAWDLKLAGAALAVLGFAAMRGRRARWGACLASALVFGVLFALHGQRRDLFLWDRYWTPWHLLAAVGTGGGLALLTARVRLGWQRWGLALALPAVLLGWHWHRCDRSHATLAADYAERLLALVPPGARLICEGDDNVSNPLLYFIAGEGRRPDLTCDWRGMRPPHPLRFDAGRLRSGDQVLVWTHPPDFPADWEQPLRDDQWGLVSVGRLVDQPVHEPGPWGAWAIASFEQAPPPDGVFEPLERELLAQYFIQKARALDAGDRAAADTALACALSYALGSEFALQRVWQAAGRLHRDDVRRVAYEQILALSRRAARAIAGS